MVPGGLMVVGGFLLFFGALAFHRQKPSAVEAQDSDAATNFLDDIDIGNVVGTPAVGSDPSSPSSFTKTPKSPVREKSRNSELGLPSRLVVSEMTYWDDPADTLHRTIRVMLNNKGQGPAYEGHGYFAFLPDDMASETNLEEALNSLTHQARSADYNKNRSIEVGEDTGFEVRSKLPADIWQNVVSGKSTAVAVAVYGYLDDSLYNHTVKITFRVMRYFDGNGSGMNMEIVRQGTNIQKREG